MQRPSVKLLPSALADAARSIARRVAEGGQRAWIVGGGVRDLALGIESKDLDMASAAKPEEVEAMFAGTLYVGKQFGTSLVHVGAVRVELASFRSESDHDEHGRPRTRSFVASAEEDARRRDFTINALYLDPLTDELFDPSGGLLDLERGRLRCVGVALQRFGEDPLRILRLARFAAGFEFEVDAATRAAACASLDGLAGISPERIAAELRTMHARGAGARALGLLAELGVLVRILPLDGVELDRRLDALAHLGRGPELFESLGWLLEQRLSTSRRELELLVELRYARDVARAAQELARSLCELRALLALEDPRGDRARWIRFARAESASSALSLLRAEAGDATLVEGLVAHHAALSESDLRPAPLLGSRDLDQAGVPRGPLWAELLELAETAQLDGALADREAALTWLRAELARRVT